MMFPNYIFRQRKDYFDKLQQLESFKLKPEFKDECVKLLLESETHKRLLSHKIIQTRDYTCSVLVNRTQKCHLYQQDL